MRPLNILPEPKPPSIFSLIVSQFRSFLVILLIFAALFSFFLKEYWDTAFILFIVLINAAIGFGQELKAQKEIAALKKLIVPFARVIREGKEIKIEAKFLVPGDLLVLSEGDRIPADAILTSSKNISVSEAILTGESAPIEKDAHDLVFLATTILSGHGTARVTTIGADTKFGQIATSLSEIPDDPTPLEKTLDATSKKIGLGMVVILAIVITIGLIQQRDLRELTFSGIALAVAAIPEGLPAVLTIALAIGVSRLAQKKAIAKKLSAAQALGSIDVICTDKTGTLTRNEMVVKKIVFADGHERVIPGVGYSAREKIIFSPKEKSLVTACLLCNTSSLVLCQDQNETYTVLGDTTEGALLVLGLKSGESYQSVRDQNPILEEIPFESHTRFMAVKTANMNFAKGAPEIILEKSTNLNAVEKEKFFKKIQDLGKMGYRILAIADSKKSMSDNLNFLGLVVISDPPRPEVKSAIASCNKAGIKVVMITGDSPQTAMAIACEIGLIQKGEEIVTGDQLNNFSDEILQKNLEKVAVFARVNPRDKLRIVTAFQNLGLTVATTGDGVNDSPAIKKADIGIAMGQTGTDVSKEAADLIITDDNFATIVTAIEEGRTTLFNLSKAISFLLISNVGEITTVIFAMLAGLPLPFSPLALLWLNVASDSLPALALAVDTKDKASFTQSPAHVRALTNPVSPLRVKMIILVGLVVGLSSVVLFYFFLPLGISRARLILLSSFVVFEIAVAFFVRGKHQGFLSNRPLIFASILSLGFQLIIVFSPFLRERLI